jgi:hypothetical protein
MSSTDNTFFQDITPTSNLVRKFYLLEYFLILLKSVEHYSNQDDIFESFKKLKKKYQLGDSKYKKLTYEEDEEPTKKQIIKFRYTFDQVLHEALNYNLVEKRNLANPIIHGKSSAKKQTEYERSKNVYLTINGEKALAEYIRGKFNFNLFLFKLMEDKHKAFYELIKLCYKDSTLKNGLLIFPIYSGLKLGFDKSTFTTHQHVLDYSRELTKQLERDIKEYTNKDISLLEAEEKLINKLKQDNIISDNPADLFQTKFYNAALSRFRKYWLSYFLKDIYGYKYSFSTFSIWIERAKQIGILYTTEFFPDISGRIVFPTSIILDSIKNQDFEIIYTYSTGEKLCLHKPKWNNNYQEEFVKTLQEEFLFLQKTRKTHFINLLDLKERVCFKKRIPGFIFDEFLEKAYLMNLKGEIRIKIALEVDKLPQETNAMYLKREPILINGKYKNIIAINYGGI